MQGNDAQEREASWTPGNKDAACEQKDDAAERKDAAGKQEVDAAGRKDAAGTQEVDAAVWKGAACQQREDAVRMTGAAGTERTDALCNAAGIKDASGREREEASKGNNTTRRTNTTESCLTENGMNAAKFGEAAPGNVDILKFNNVAGKTDAEIFCNSADNTSSAIIDKVTGGNDIARDEKVASDTYSVESKKASGISNTKMDKNAVNNASAALYVNADVTIAADNATVSASEAENCNAHDCTEAEKIDNAVNNADAAADDKAVHDAGTALVCGCESTENNDAFTKDADAAKCREILEGMNDFSI